MALNNQIKYGLFWVIVALIAFVPMLSKSQTTDLYGDDVLLKEYLFPISVPRQPEGRAQVKKAIECSQFTSQAPAASLTPACQSSWENSQCLVESADSCNLTNGGIYLNQPFLAHYKFILGTKGNYSIKVKLSNLDDNFSALSIEQIDYLLSVLPTETVNQINKTFNEIPAQANGQYDVVRSLILGVYVDGQTTSNLKGYVIVPAGDSVVFQEGVAILDNLDAGEHEIILKDLVSLNYDFSNVTLPAGMNDFTNVDINTDKKLTVSPVVYEVSMDRVVAGDDIVGVRIYSNKQNKDPLTWYRDNVINAASNVTQTTVDGYRAIRDGRTVYVEAANLVELPKVCQGTSIACNFTSDCGDKQCVMPKQFYTNIYVIAFNQNAATETDNIFEQMLENWVFNTNLINLDPFNAESKKDKLRRDTIRKTDAFKMQELLDSYKSAHGGQCPLLAAGTFVKGHAISVWPSWQATLGNELGSGLPSDPLNILSPVTSGPNDCTSSVNINAGKCANLCTDNNYGCAANEQCIDNQYCSVCPPGYDAQTCWDNIKLQFPFETHGTCSAGNGYLSNYFILGGDKCENNGSYIYQYAVNPTNSADCNFLIRYEFEEQEVCSPGQCAFNDQCYNPGACLAGCDNGTCVNENYKNLYCYLGSWRTSCGNGFIEAQCGESCDFMSPQVAGASWCDSQPGYGSHDWYNESAIATSCNNQCQWEGFETLGYTPQPYTANPSDLDCGGYCGNSVRESVSVEQCDLGPIPAEVPRPDNDVVGSSSKVGGLTKNLQYLCSGSTQSGPLRKEATDCTNYWNYDKSVSGACSSMPVYVSPATPWVTSRNGVIDGKSYSNDISSLGGFGATYQFEVSNSGLYDFKIKAANDNDNIYNLSDSQIDYIMSLAGTVSGLHHISKINDVPTLIIGDGYGEFSLNDPQKEYLRAMRYFIFSIYLDGQDVSNRAGFISLAATDLNNPQEGSISLGNLDKGAHTVTINFLSDNFYLNLNDTNSTELGSLATVNYSDDGYLDINPVIYEVALTSLGADVGQCKTYGGWCGDGKVQLQYGEKCDIANYITPAPKDTVNIAKNSSFEEVLSPWQATGATLDLSQTYSFDGQFSLFIQSGAFSESAKTFSLNQANTFYKNSAYNISLKIRPQSGQINTVSLDIGDQSAATGWFGTQLFTKAATEIGGWQIFEINNYTPSDYGYKFRLNFTTISGTTFYLDDVQVIPLDPKIRPQYRCLNADGQICQYADGFCGDGKLQLDFGETCDDRVGLSCVNNEGCGLNGQCVNGTCSSIKCNDTCRSTFCGDGIVQRPNSLGLNEVCDYGSDPTCSYSCRQIRMGGTCAADLTSPCNPDSDANCKICEPNLSCSIRNFGDTAKKCLGARGSLGCRTNNDCIIGYYCNVSTAKCEPEISTYLRYHPEEKTSLVLPAPSSSAYDINISRCPDIYSVVIDSENQYLVDRCTGINWSSVDNISKPSWNFAEALEDGCGSGVYRLPSISELYSLVKQTNQLGAVDLIYADQSILKLCPLKCEYNENDLTDFCNDPCGDNNYLYWSGTCTQKIDGVCTKALAVNYRYGSIEEYATSEQFKVRCLKDTFCGNGKIEEGETCEFYQSTTGKIEQKIAGNDDGSQCKKFGYDGGYLHCDEETCTYKFDNCYFGGQVGQSCEQICQGQKTLACRSVGLNAEDNKDGGVWNISDNHLMMEVDSAGKCVVAEIPGASQTDYCNYKFMDREKNCLDTLTNKTAPYRSQYSYCNCEE